MMKWLRGLFQQTQPFSQRESEMLKQIDELVAEAGRRAMDIKIKDAHIDYLEDQSARLKEANVYLYKQLERAQDKVYALMDVEEKEVQIADAELALSEEIERFKSEVDHWKQLANQYRYDGDQWRRAYEAVTRRQD